MSLKQLLKELRRGGDAPTQLICDNQAAIHIALNPVFHERTKHREVNCHSFGKSLSQRCTSAAFIKPSEQLAAILTKSLTSLQNLVC